VEIVVPAEKESENRRMAWAVAPLCTVRAGGMRIVVTNFYSSDINVHGCSCLLSLLFFLIPLLPSPNSHPGAYSGRALIHGKRSFHPVENARSTPTASLSQTAA
jgi:hypothetical protein